MSETIIVGIIGGLFSLLSIFITHRLTLKKDKERANLIKQLEQDNSSLKSDLEELKKTIPKNFEILENVQEVLKEKILPIIREQIKIDDRIIIDNFGLDLQSVIPWIEDHITTKELNNVEIKIKSLIINPNSENIKNLLGAPGNIRSSTVLSSIDTANEFNNLENLLNFSLQIRQYNLPPIFHGFLLNKEHLFIGFTELHGGKIEGGKKPYLHLWKDGKTKSDFNLHYFQFFKDWFDYFWSISKEVANVKK